MRRDKYWAAGHSFVSILGIGAAEAHAAAIDTCHQVLAVASRFNEPGALQASSERSNCKIAQDARIAHDGVLDRLSQSACFEHTPECFDVSQFRHAYVPMGLANRVRSLAAPRLATPGNPPEGMLKEVPVHPPGCWLAPTGIRSRLGDLIAGRSASLRFPRADLVRLCTIKLQSNTNAAISIFTDQPDSERLQSLA